jgi:hypothetical protein
MEHAACVIPIREPTATLVEIVGSLVCERQIRGGTTQISIEHRSGRRAAAVFCYDQLDHLPRLARFLRPTPFLSIDHGIHILLKLRA